MLIGVSLGDGPVMVMLQTWFTHHGVLFNIHNDLNFICGGGHPPFAKRGLRRGCRDRRNLCT